MENDPNKKESKGKRILKKALRRTSKSSNSSTNESSLAISRSKSCEANPGVAAANDSAPLPKPDGAADPELIEAPAAAKKTVDIQEGNNIIHEDNTPSTRDLKHSSQEEYLSEPSTSKKNLKRVCY